MGRTLDSRRHEILRAFLVEHRIKAGLRQVDLAKRLGRSQSYVTHIEAGQKHVGLLELIEWAEAIGFDPEEAIERIFKLTSK
jgi:transcriptional regulator with XRE-family HTH domain